MAVQISGNDITVPRDGTFTRNVTIGGTLTYEDVTNIDSVGLVTARTGIEIGARPGVAASISVDGNMIVSGISTFGGDVQVPDKIIHAGDTNTSIRFPDADTISAETGGSERLRITSTGKVTIGDLASPDGNLHVYNSSAGSVTAATDANELVLESATNVGMSFLTANDSIARIKFGDPDATNAGVISYVHSDNSMRFTTNTGETLRINSDGRVLVNIQASRNVGSANARMLQVESSGGGSGISIVRNSNNASGPTLDLGKSRGYPNTIVQSGDKLGVVNFCGADGTNLETVGAQITGEVDGTPGENDMPGRIVFKTTADGAASSTERARIDSGGRMGVGLIPNTSDVATNISPGLIQTDGNIDLRYSGTNNDPAGARYVNFINTDTTLVAGQPLGGLHWIGNDSENANAINAAILVDCAGNSGTDAHLLFKTSGSQRIRIKNNGDLVSSSGSTSRIAFGSGDGTLYSGMGYYAGGNQDVGLSLYATTNAGVQFVEHFRMEHNGTLKATDTSIGSLSDIRLKTDIKDYSYDISKFKQFKPKSFNWINPEVHGDKSNVKGFIAQDIELVDKDWVEDSWISEDNPDFALISNTTDINGAGETVGVSKISKFGYKDAMYISVIQQLIDRIETLESS